MTTEKRREWSDGEAMAATFDAGDIKLPFENGDLVKFFLALGRVLLAARADLAEAQVKSERLYKLLEDALQSHCDGWDIWWYICNDLPLKQAGCYGPECCNLLPREQVAARARLEGAIETLQVALHFVVSSEQVSGYFEARIVELQAELEKLDNGNR